MTKPRFDRGYTMHEHYDGFTLINMNGRLYAPTIGRMMQPDIVIQNQYNSQAYNSYSYCLNNPLRFTDPSGYVVTPFSNFKWDYNFLDFSMIEKPNNGTFNTELTEGKHSPIYDINGFFLGTDDEGLQGEAIIMRRKDFRQGMSHDEALSMATDLSENNRESATARMNRHYASLRNRPDWDGIVTDLEAREWWAKGQGEPLFINQSLMDLSPVTTDYFDKSNTITHNFFFDKKSNKDIGRVYGTLTLHLINSSTGEVKIGNTHTAYIDTYDFNNGGDVFRNIATWGAKIIVGEGVSFKIYGWGKNPNIRVIWKN